jgi:hypothetical protein
VPAALARRLGSFLLTETMERRPDIGLDSYDRLFPNQDKSPQGGFGNPESLKTTVEPALSVRTRPSSPASRCEVVLLPGLEDNRVGRAAACPVVQTDGADPNDLHLVGTDHKRRFFVDADRELVRVRPTLAHCGHE